MRRYTTVLINLYFSKSIKQIVDILPECVLCYCVGTPEKHEKINLSDFNGPLPERRLCLCKPHTAEEGGEAVGYGRGPPSPYPSTRSRRAQTVQAHESFRERLEAEYESH